MGIFRPVMQWLVVEIYLFLRELATSQKICQTGNLLNRANELENMRLNSLNNELSILNVPNQTKV